MCGNKGNKSILKNRGKLKKVNIGFMSLFIFPVNRRQPTEERRNPFSIQNLYLSRKILKKETRIERKIRKAKK